MRLGVIGDDFTGASDMANTLAKGRAGIVSLKSRSIPAREVVAGGETSGAVVSARALKSGNFDTARTNVKLD